MLYYIILAGVAAHLVFCAVLFVLIRRKKVCYTLAGFPLVAGIPFFGFLFVAIYASVMKTPMESGLLKKETDAADEDVDVITGNSKLLNEKIVELTNTVNTDMKERGPVRLSEVRRERAVYRPFLSPGSLVHDLDVPIEEASLLYPTWKKRRMVMDFLELEQDEQKQARSTGKARGTVSDANYNTVLEKTRLDADPEVSHYAASALAEIRVSYE